MILSVIIIGYNASKDLNACLTSINNQKNVPQNIEILYVDDGSSDGSVQIFNSFNLKFKKKCIIHSNNLGRNFARNSGIKNASGEWCLFLNSNIYLNENVFFNYLHEIKNPSSLILTGNIKYTCSDLNFSFFLNNPKRAINNYKSKQIIPYYYLLFSNACIKRSLLVKNFFDDSFSDYGGSEMELAYRLNKNSNILFIPNTFATRFNHPSLIQHSFRIESFGKNNIFFLFQKISKHDLPKYFCFFSLFLNKFSFLLLPSLYLFRWILYKSLPVFPKTIRFNLIKIILGLSLIVGISKNNYINK